MCWLYAAAVDDQSHMDVFNQVGFVDERQTLLCCILNIVDFIVYCLIIGW